MVPVIVFLILVSANAGHAAGVCSVLGLGKEGRTTAVVGKFKSVVGRFLLDRESRKFDSDRFYKKKAQFLAGAGDLKIENGTDLLAWIETTNKIDRTQWTTLPSETGDHLLEKARLFKSVRKDLHKLAKDGLSESEIWQLATSLYLATHLDAESLEFLLGHGYREAFETLARQRIEIGILQKDLSDAMHDLGLSSHTPKAEIQNFLYEIKDKLSVLMTALIDVPVLLQGFVPVLPRISTFPAWLQVIYTPFRRVWNKVALTAMVLAVLQTVTPHDSQADALSAEATRQYLKQSLGRQQGESQAAEKAIGAFGEAAKRMAIENKERSEVFAAVIAEDIKLIDQKIRGLSEQDPSVSGLLKKRAELVALMSEMQIR